MNKQEQEKIKMLYDHIDNSYCTDSTRPYYEVGYNRCRQEMKELIRELFPEVVNK